MREEDLVWSARIGARGGVIIGGIAVERFRGEGIEAFRVAYLSVISLGGGVLICPSPSDEPEGPDAGESPDAEELSAAVVASRVPLVPLWPGADGSSAESAEPAAAPSAEGAWGASLGADENRVPEYVPAAKTSMGGGLFNLPRPGRERRRGAQPAGERGGEAEAQKRPLLLREHGFSPSVVDLQSARNILHHLGFRKIAPEQVMSDEP